ncbi:MAG: hypothetical protein JWR68_114 [Polaromonas sp.]|nr:hypothetical protein [Polaromonas sp.]
MTLAGAKLIPLLKRLLKGLLLAPVALLLLFEEWGWEPLARCFAALGRLPLWRQLERFILGLPPWAALLAFGVPALALVPIKLLALFLLGKGHLAGGMALILSAKVAGTALAARLFQLTQPALMRIGWFARLYTPWKRWKDRMLRRVRVSYPWRLGRRTRRWNKKAWSRLRTSFKTWLVQSEK